LADILFPEVYTKKISRKIVVYQLRQDYQGLIKSKEKGVPFTFN
jgi:hypothetical protein